MIADTISPFPPINADPWHTWLRYPGDRKRFVLMPSGEWRLNLDLSQSSQGIATTGGKAAGRIDGGHGHLPAWLANAIGTLKCNGSTVVTVNRMAEAAAEIVKQFAPKEPVIEGGKVGKSTLDLMVAEQGVCLFRADNQEVVVTDDVLPRMKSGKLATWEKSVFIPQPILTDITQYQAMLSGSGRFRRLLGTDVLQWSSKMNYGYPTGLWLHRIPQDDVTAAPRFRAYSGNKAGHDNCVIATYLILGVE